MATGTDFNSKQPLIDSVQLLVTTNTNKSTTSDKIQEAILSTIETLFGRIEQITGENSISISPAAQALGITLVNSLLNVTQASPVSPGLLSQEDWTTFNNKITSETVTSLSIQGNDIIYTDEENNITTIAIPLQNQETLTSLSIVNGSLVYTDENSNITTLILPDNNNSSTETLTSLVRQQDNLIYTDENGNENTISLPTSTTTEVSNLIINQTAHGFTLGQVVYVDNNVWRLAIADANAEVNDSFATEIVTKITDANTFEVAGEEYVSVNLGLTNGSVLYLSDTTAGGFTTVEPSTFVQHLGYYNNGIIKFFPRPPQGSISPDPTVYTVQQVDNDDYSLTRIESNGLIRIKVVLKPRTTPLDYDIELIPSGVYNNFAFRSYDQFVNDNNSIFIDDVDLSFNQLVTGGTPETFSINGRQIQDHTRLDAFTAGSLNNATPLYNPFQNLVLLDSDNILMNVSHNGVDKGYTLIFEGLVT